MEIDEAMEFQRRSWIVQRIGWVFFALVLLLACLGLFGNGPLSDAKAGQENGTLWLEYPRFARFKDEFRITAHVNSGTATEGETMIQLDREYLERVEVSNIIPEPDAEINAPGQVTYVFKTNNANPPFTAYFYLTPREVGMQAGTFQLQNEQVVRFSQFIYP